MIMVYVFLLCCWVLFATILLRIFCIYVHQWYWPVAFFFGVVFVWFWHQSDSDPGKLVWKCSFLFNFLKEFQTDYHYIISKCLRELTCETIRPCALIFWEFFYHIFYFSACNWLVHNFYFFLVQSWKIEVF